MDHGEKETEKGSTVDHEKMRERRGKAGVNRGPYRVEVDSGLWREIRQSQRRLQTMERRSRVGVDSGPCRAEVDSGPCSAGVNKGPYRAEEDSGL